MNYKKQNVLVAHELPMDFAIFTPPRLYVYVLKKLINEGVLR